MPSLNDELLREDFNEVNVEGEIEETIQNDLENPLNKIVSMLWADTGEGEIEDYIEHPFNFKKSEGLAQIIRGMTGILGNFRKAIFDIIFGFLKYKEELKE